MTLEGSGMLETAAKVQYLHTLVWGESLRQLDTLSADVESTNPLTVEAIILGLCAYFPPVNSLLKQNQVMCSVMRKPCGLKVRCYANRLIDLNEYWALFPGAELADKIVMTELGDFF